MFPFTAEIDLGLPNAGVERRAATLRHYFIHGAPARTNAREPGTTSVYATSGGTPNRARHKGRRVGNGKHYRQPLTVAPRFHHYNRRHCGGGGTKVRIRGLDLQSCGSPMPRHRR